MSWALPFPIGFVALYTRSQPIGGGVSKYTLPIVGAVQTERGSLEHVPSDFRKGTILVPAPARSPQSGRVVPATTAMDWEDGWKFKGIGYAEVDDDEQGEQHAGSDVPSAGS